MSMILSIRLISMRMILVSKSNSTSMIMTSICLKTEGEPALAFIDYDYELRYMEMFILLEICKFPKKITTSMRLRLLKEMFPYIVARLCSKFSVLLYILLHTNIYPNRILSREILYIFCSFINIFPHKNIRIDRILNIYFAHFACI